MISASGFGMFFVVRFAVRLERVSKDGSSTFVMGKRALKELAVKRLGQTDAAGWQTPTLNRWQAASLPLPAKIVIMLINIDENTIGNRPECQPAAAGILVQAVTRLDALLFHRWPSHQLHSRLPTSVL